MTQKKTTAVARISPEALALEFADNPQPRCPCVLVLDASSSMAGQPISQLNEALRTFAEDVRRDALASQRVEVAVVEFSTRADVVRDFVTVDDFTPPTIYAEGLTAMGSGLNLALDILEERKKQYNDNGISYFRPWLFLLTDGQPEGEREETTMRAFARVRTAHYDKKVNFFPIGTGGANLSLLSSITGKPAMRVEVAKFSELFVWLSRSVQMVSNSREGDQITLPDQDWSIAWS